MHNVLWVMELLRLMLKGMHDIREVLRITALSLVCGGQQKLFTPMYLVVSQKLTTL
ncbi:hypothetical protein B0H10DRAFT_2212841 [Mycena sp. CBHHK59/15]|nr:hypothetical protein B0H10DRAFT_2212841 [Mycena sp. CBHHK59/15]